MHCDIKLWCNFCELSFYPLSAQEKEEHFPRRLWHKVWPSAHAATGSDQAANAQDEGPEKEKR